MQINYYRPDNPFSTTTVSAFSVIYTRKQILQNIQVGGELTDRPKSQEILKWIIILTFVIWFYAAVILMYSDSICCTVLRKIEETAREGNIKENVNTQSPRLLVYDLKNWFA